MDRHLAIPRRERRGQSGDVRLMRVHSTRGHEPQDVNRAASLVRAASRFADEGISCEASVSDRFVDPRQVLHHDPPGTQIEMPDLRITELTLGEPDFGSVGSQKAPRTACPQVVEDWLIGQSNGVVFALHSPPEAVEDDEDHGSWEG